MDDEVSKAGKDTEKDKNLKWETPKLHDLKSATATGDCVSGSGDSGTCSTGTTAVDSCDSGSGGDLPPPPPMM